CEATTVRTNNAKEGAMKRDTENETPETRNLSRREVLGLIGATAAASLVGGAGEQSASAQQTSAPTQNMRSRIVKLDAKPEPIAIRSEEHTSELQSRFDLVCRLLLEKKK